jgi:hypothetical protein
MNPSLLLYNFFRWKLKYSASSVFPDLVNQPSMTSPMHAYVMAGQIQGLGKDEKPEEFKK